MLTLILLVFAFVLFVIAALSNLAEPPWKTRLVCAGLACWVLSELLKGIPMVR
jgi:hypothetical protein